MLTISDQLGRALRLSFDNTLNQVNKVEEIVDGVVQRFISFTYSDTGLLETFTDARGKTTRYSYHDVPQTPRHNLLKSITYPKGNTVEIDYDQDSQRVTSITMPGNPTPATVSYPTANTTEVTDPRGKIFHYSHDSLGRLTSQSGPDLNDASFEYTDSNNPNKPTRIEDKEGNPTLFGYDPRGNLTKITNAANSFATFTYNEQNNLTYSTRFHALTETVPEMKYYYDGPGVAAGNRLERVTNPANETTYMYYDADHQLIRSTDPRGFDTTFTYDGFGNIEKITDAESNSTTFTNDYAGRTTEVEDAENIKTSYDFDANNYLTDVINYAKNQQTELLHVSMLYDFNGNKEKVSWQNNGSTVNTRYAYDAYDRLSSVSDPLGKTLSFTYYDETNQIKTRKDARNITTTYEYDDNKRLERVISPSRTTTLSRDNNGNVSSIAGENGISRFEYNELNLLKKYTDPYSQIVQYEYDTAGRLRKLTYPGVDKVVTYTYDEAGRLHQVADWLNNTTTYEYDQAGNLQQISRQNNTKTLFSHDRASQLTGISEQDSSSVEQWSFSFELDGVGNHNSMTDSDLPLTGSSAIQGMTYSHNLANRITNAGSVTYTYDDNGNRFSMDDSGAITGYQWDEENRLIMLARPDSTTVRHYYDAMGNRIAKDDNGIVTRYALDLNGEMSRVLVETDAAGTVQAYYVYGIGLLSRITPPDEVRYYHFNHRGDTIAMTDETGVVTDAYAYGEYGLVEATLGTSANSFKFVGRYGVMYEGNATYFMRARFYDARTGRFLSEDPLGFSGGDWNLSAYVGGNPVVGIDPRGLDWKNSAWFSLKKTGKFSVRLAKEVPYLTIATASLLIADPAPVVTQLFASTRRASGISWEGYRPEGKEYWEEMWDEFFEKGLVTLASKKVPILDLYSSTAEVFEWWIMYTEATGGLEIK